jgi:hypothetical protein
MQPDVKLENKVVENNISTPSQNIEQKNNVQQTSEPQETQKDIDWKKFKAERQKERDRLAESEKARLKTEQEAAALRAALEAAVNKPTSYSQQHLDDSEETEEQRIEKMVTAKIEKRQRELESERMAQEQANYPTKLVQTFSDFNQVCSTENLDYLEYHYPEIAEGMKLAPDGYNKWAAIYKAVKKFVPNTDTKRDIGKAEKNLNKPQSMSTGMTQNNAGAPPVRLDAARRQANWERMQRIVKGLKE